MKKKETKTGRVFACSDLHGMMPLYKQICDFLEPDDKVIYLGDAADRGPNGWELIKAIYHNPQWIYLCGNHEDMLANAIDEYTFKRSISKKHRQLLFDNGGKVTLFDWADDGADFEWSDILRELPVHYIYKNVENKEIVLSHAGFHPFFNRDDMLPEDREDFIWDRDHIKLTSMFGWPSSLEDVILVHGHTPIQTMIQNYEPGALWYCDDHKICIDNASFFSGKTCLFDLDSYEEHVFEIPNFINQ